MLLNKENRIKYLGFDDKWFFGIGILVLGLITHILFHGAHTIEANLHFLYNYGISVFFSFCNWFIMRTLMLYLRKRFPEFKDNTKRIVLVFASIIATVFVVDIIGNIFLSFAIGSDYHAISKSQMLIPILLISIMVIAIYEAIYFYNRLQKSVRDEEQSKRAVVQSQLDALQNQSQPHFLFNSLNTLRDIIDQDTKEDAKKFVDKLSDVYRFILESGTDNLTTLRKEVKFAKSYTHIQLERFGNNLNIDWNIPKTSSDTLIAPMSLQLLLENAIKHNVISKAKPLSITVTANENQLVVENKIQPKSTQIPSTKLGLKNVEKRYELLSGESITIENNGKTFKVSIPLLKSSDQKNKPCKY